MGVRTAFFFFYHDGEFVINFESKSFEYVYKFLSTRSSVLSIHRSFCIILTSAPPRPRCPYAHDRTIRPSPPERNFVFFYVVLLHLVVFFTLNRWSLSHAANCGAAMDP